MHYFHRQGLAQFYFTGRHADIFCLFSKMVCVSVLLYLVQISWYSCIMYMYMCRCPPGLESSGPLKGLRRARHHR